MLHVLEADESPKALPFIFSTKAAPGESSAVYRHASKASEQFWRSLLHLNTLGAHESLSTYYL